MIVDSDYRARSKPSVECPACGSPRCAKLGGGRANDGSIPIRYRRCRDCEHSFVTAEVVVPGMKSISPLDEDFRKRNRDYKRVISNYKGGVPRGGVRVESDRLIVSVKVQRKPRQGYRRAA